MLLFGIDAAILALDDGRTVGGAVVMFTVSAAVVCYLYWRVGGRLSRGAR